MIPKAVEKARDRLRIARKQLELAEKAPDYNSFKDEWYLFLVASKNVYTCLEQAAKDTAQCRQWFGAKKQERRSDPLLQYLFQARDDDEHGVEAVVGNHPGGIGIGVNAPGYSNDISLGSVRIEGRKMFIDGLKSNDGKPVLIANIPPHPELIAVRGRGGITYYPPWEHLGQKLPDQAPITVGKVALSYLSALVEEASGRA